MPKEIEELRQLLTLSEQISANLRKAIYSRKINAPNTIEQFIKECCLLGDNRLSTISSLYDGLIAYCAVNNLQCPSKNKLSRELKHHNCVYALVNQSRGVRGIQLATYG